METPVFKTICKLSTTFAINHGTFPCDVVNELLLLLLSEECLCLPVRGLQGIVQNLTGSLIYPFNYKKYRQRFKNVPNDVKKHLATNTTISHVLALTQDERSEYLSILQAIQGPHDAQWFEFLETTKAHFELLSNGKNIEHCDFLARKFCAKMAFEESYFDFNPLRRRLQLDLMKHYLDNNLMDQARSFIGFVE